MTDLKKLATKLMGIADDYRAATQIASNQPARAWAAARDKMQAILAKHFPPAEPKPAVSMEAVVERIAVKMAGRGADHEHIKEIIRDELAEVADVLEMARAFVRERYQLHCHTAAMVIDQDSLSAWDEERKRLIALSGRITKLTGGTNGEG